MLEFDKPYRYKDICEILSIPRLSGSQQRTQLNELNKLYQIDKIGKDYIVRKQYSDEEIKQNEIRGLYVKLFSVVLSSLLISQEKSSVCYSMMDLLLETKMVNADYRYCRYNVNGASLILNTDPNQLEFYTTKSYLLMSRLVKDMLNILEDKSLIIVRKGFKLYKDHGGFTETKVINLGSKEESEILSIEKYALDEMKQDSLQQIYKSEHSTKKFKTISQKKCREVFDGWDGYFNVYHITLNRSGLRCHNEEVYKELNDKIKNKLFDSKVLENVIDLPKLIAATVDLERPYKIKEKIREKANRNDVL